MYFKKLVGKKCYLSPIDVNDAEKFTEWLNDMEVMKHFTLYSNMISLENEKEILASLSKEHNYSVINLETNQIIGGISNNEYNTYSISPLNSYNNLRRRKLLRCAQNIPIP